MTGAEHQQEMREALIDEVAGWHLGRGCYQHTINRDDATEIVDHVIAVAAIDVMRGAADDGAIDAAHLAHQRDWSRATFGPGPRTAGVVDHIRKELTEIEDDPTDLGEWVDVVILAFDGAWRAGWEPAEIIAAIKAKQARNEARTWPDWRTADPDRAIEHDRSKDVA